MRVQKRAYSRVKPMFMLGIFNLNRSNRFIGKKKNPSWSYVSMIVCGICRSELGGAVAYILVCTSGEVQGPM